MILNIHANSTRNHVGGGKASQIPAAGGLSGVSNFKCTLFPFSVMPFKLTIWISINLHLHRIILPHTGIEFFPNNIKSPRLLIKFYFHQQNPSCLWGQGAFKIAVTHLRHAIPFPAYSFQSCSTIRF